MNSHLLAIDPGSVSGAYAMFHGDGLIEAEDLPVVDRQVDAAELARFIHDVRPGAVYVEKVGAMPKQGVVSMFRFGFACGVIEGVVLGAGIPLIYVAPPTWKKKLGLIGRDKEASRALAKRLYPQMGGLSRKRDQGRAEALLIGHWALGRDVPS